MSRKEAPNLTQKLVSWSTIFVNFAAAISATSAAAAYVYKNYISYQERRDNQFNGFWTSDSEYCVDCPMNRDRILHINIKATDGYLSGIADMSNMSEPSPQTAHNLTRLANKIAFGYLDINGKLTFNKGHIEILSVENGKLINLGKVKVKLEGDTMYWSAVSAKAPQIPSTTILYRRDLKEWCNISQKDSKPSFCE